MKYIAVFDSGLGGIAVLKCLNKLLPNEGIIFFGDNKRMPYGIKNKKTIKKYAKENINFLNNFNLKAIGIACNTMDSNSHDLIVKNAKTQVYGVIDVSSKKAIKITKNKRIGILATPTTVSSHAYKNVINNLDKDVKVFELASPDLASLIEKNVNEDIIEKEIIKYLKIFDKKNIDTLVLACTHYHFCLDLIKKLRPNLKIISSSYELAYNISKNIKENNKKINNQYYVTHYYHEYEEIIKKLLKKKENIKIKEIDLKDYQ